MSGRVEVSLLVAVGLTACGAGSGSGQVQGMLWVQDCNGLKDYGSKDQPAFFDLKPDFFGAEPIEDISPSQENNRLIIRLLRSGKRLETNDGLVFDLVNTATVGRCVRGRTGDYDSKSCYWAPPDPQNPVPVGRLRIGPDQAIRANLVPRYTCKTAGPIRQAIWNTVGTAISDDADNGNWESWIEFEDFGYAAQPGRPPDQREMIGTGYKVDFGQRLHARHFQITLQDDRILKAIKRRDVPPPGEITGTLSGFFDFDLVRGQGAQTFP